MELASFQSSGAQNFEVALRFLEKFMHKSLQQNFGTPSLLSCNLRLVTVLIDFSVQTLVYFCSERYRAGKKLIYTKTLRSFQFCSYKLSNKGKLCT
jgi:hypothetical protein